MRPPAICVAAALAVLSAVAFADEDLPKVAAPTTPPDLILSCHYVGMAVRPDFTVEVWNSGIVRRDGRVESAQITFARIVILTSRQRHPSGNFLEGRGIIDRVSGDFWFESHFVDANGELATLPPDLPTAAIGSSPPAAHCQAALRKF
jgi:hypothetical protein